MLAKTKIVGLMMVLMALSAPLVYADNGGGDKGKTCPTQHGDWHHGQKDHMLAKILNLTDDQVKQMKDLREKQKDAMKATFEQIKSNRAAFDAEIVKAAPDMNVVNDLQTKLKAIQAQMVDDRLNSVLAIKKILTPEQYAGYAALKKERKMKMHMMGHHQFGHGHEFGKDGDNHHEHWGDKEDKDHDADEQQ